jgi:hypothetical protein
VPARTVSLPRVPLTLGAVYGEAWELYRLLMRRSILTAFLVFAVVDGVGRLSGLPESTAARVVLGLLSFVLTFSGPVVVQGALVHIVRNIHEGRPPERIPVLVREAGRRFWSLLGPRSSTASASSSACCRSSCPASSWPLAGACSRR